MPRPASGARRSLGWQVADWIETFCTHGPGDVVGQDVEVDEEFTAFLVKSYRVDGRGKRFARRAFLSRAKGRNKSGFAGWVCCAEGLGPVRFDHWARDGEVSYWGYEFEEGEPVGRPVVSPEILCFATEEEQAGNTYDVVFTVLSTERMQEAFPGLDPGLTRTNLPGGGAIEPVTSAASSKDGGKSTFVVFDETHLWFTPELKRTHGTVRRNLGKRKLAEPWSLETSTMYQPGQGSVAEGTHKYAEDCAAGLRPKDQGLVFDHVQGPADFDWGDDRQLKAALEVAYGPAAAWMDLVRIVAEIRDPQADEADSRRYWLNQVVKATEQVVDVRRWAGLFSLRVVEPRALVTLGFDGSRFHDSTVLLAADVAGGYLFEVGVWERPEGAKDWEVPAGEVRERVRWAFDTFSVWRMYADPPEWETDLDAWAGEFGEKRVVKWWTNRDRQMAYATKQFFADIRAGELAHDGSAVVARHLGNARKRYTKVKDEDPGFEGRPMWVMEKDGTNSPRKIDAGVAAVLAWKARSDALAEGATASAKPYSYPNPPSGDAEDLYRPSSPLMV